jgi:peptidoglycan hydrolase-like protein with peptidoglycan-binding domain
MRFQRATAAAACIGTVLALPGAAKAAFGDRTLRPGTHGHDVRVLQSWLTELGAPTTVDGRFGPATRRSVRRYERSHGLRVDGVVSRLEARGMRGRLPAAAAPNPARAAISVDGRTAVAPAGAPPAVQDAIAAANTITSTPYRYGGGHGSFKDDAYDCSGAVSFALHGAGVLDTTMDSTELMDFGARGPGTWISVYANRGHAYVVIAGLRFDTSGHGERGPRWRSEPRSGRGYVVRHPVGL